MNDSTSNIPRAPGPKPGSEQRRVRVPITEMTLGPYGVGRLDGKTVLVPNTAPGDLVDVVIEQDRRERGHHVGDRVTIAWLGNGKNLRLLAWMAKRHSPRGRLSAHADEGENQDVCFGHRRAHLRCAQRLTVR